MFQHKQTEVLAISMKYFSPCANILEVKTYNNTVLTDKTKELIQCVIVSAERKKKFETNTVFGDAYRYAVTMIMLRHERDAPQ